jgi:hypothetical protein
MNWFLLSLVAGIIVFALIVVPLMVSKKAERNSKNKGL